MKSASIRNTCAATLAASLVAGALGYAYFAPDLPKAAPLVLFTTVKGELIRTSDLRGKVVLVNFWATDCVVCREDMPRMVETYNHYRALGFETVAVAMSYDPPNYVLSYAERNKLPFKVALDVQGKVARQFGDVDFTPTSFLIDKRGVIVKRYVGAPDVAELRGLVEAALNGPA
jgi:peroxiredoxin